MIVLVDTNVLIDALNAKRRSAELLVTLAGTEEVVLATCDVIVAEIFCGVRARDWWTP